MKNIAINGFGRIGRSFLRSYLSDAQARTTLKIAAINVGPSKIENVAHMFKYDSFMGTLPYDVSYHDGSLLVDGLVIPLIGVMNPADAGWNRFGIDWVVEATGFFTTREKAALHIAGGAQRVLITAPGKQVDVSIVPGVNDDEFYPEKHRIVSLASCTTNALAPMLKVLHEKFGIETAFMNTIHSYTNSQVLLDVESKDLRESRAATLSIIPSTSGASSAIKEVYPVLSGKINQAFRDARDGYLKDILDSTTLPLVSIDYTNNPHSVIIDELLTDVNGTSGKVFGWYDNEYGYSCRIKDFLIR